MTKIKKVGQSVDSDTSTTYDNYTTSFGNSQQETEKKMVRLIFGNRNPDKKETDKWFQVQGHRVPTGVTTYGFIRMLPLNLDFVNSKIKNTPVSFDISETDSNGTVLSKEQAA